MNEITAVAWTGPRPTVLDVARFLAAWVASFKTGTWQPGEFQELWVIRIRGV